MVPEISNILSFISFSSLVIVSSYSSSIPYSLMHCLSDHKFSSNISVLDVLYAPKNSSYLSIVESSIQNLRFSISTATTKPLAIITPLVYSHVQATVICCKQNGLQMRIRSGGHDFEGTSYTSQVPFVILDLKNLRSISIDIDDNSAWVESGATTGELHYSIAARSLIHAFPTGNYPGVGIGGQFSGGGIGNLIRKYGLAADNIIDAILVDANGKVLDKESMGTDLFWAIRGGGGASFGVIVAWKIRLVHVPPIVTVFQLSKTLEQGAIELIDKWQYIGHKLNEDLLISIIISSGYGTPTKAIFQSLFLGKADQLLKVMEKSFPQIRLKKEDCIEMSWIESVLYFSKYQGGETIEALKNRIQPLPSYSFKGKSDLVYKPISYEALEEIWKRYSDVDSPTVLYLHPYGGIMEEISESETPFPYRKGVIYELLYVVTWKEDNQGESSEKYMNWIRGLYEFMAPYVSQGPRGGIVNIRDLDLGSNDVFGTTYSKAKAWGSTYFKNNFKRLVLIKGVVDPDNFFHHEQSIPPLVSHAKGGCRKENLIFLDQCIFEVY